MSTKIGRVELDSDFRTWDQTGDDITASIQVKGPTVAAAQWAARALVGYDLNPDEPVIPITSTAWPDHDGFYSVTSLKVSPVGAPDQGVFEADLRLVRVTGFALPVIDWTTEHGQRAGYNVAAGTCRALIGWPAAAVFVTADSEVPTVTELTRTGDDGDVTCVHWAADGDQVPWRVVQVLPEDWHVGACEVLEGPPLVPPSILHQADGWWSALEWAGSGDIEDLSGNGNDGTPTNGSGVAEPVLCVYEGTQWAFFPGWEDEGASTDGVAPSGTLDVRWESSPLPIDVSVTDYWPVHLGSDDDELGFTVRQEIGTGELELRFSLDGSTAVTATATALPSGADAGQRRITRNPTTGDVTFYERASGVLTSDAGWTQVGAVVTAATGAINSDPTQSLAISGPTTGATWDSVGQGFGGRLDRLVVSDGTGVLADFDPTLAARPFATFTGGASETWTFHRATSTGSFRVGVVDRTCVMFGNTSYFDMGDVLDAGTGPVTVVHAFWHQMATPSLAGLVGKGNAVSNPTGQGYGLGMLDNTGGGPGTGGLLGVASDGTDYATSLAAGAPKPAMGTVSTVALVLDRDADEVTTYVDGVAASAGDATAVGDVGNSDPFRVGAVWNDGQQAWIGTAVFLGALTAAEIDQAGDELTAAAIPEPNTIDEQLAAYQPVTGRQLPAHKGWCLTNHHVRCYPDVGAVGVLAAQWWDSTSWTPAKTFAFGKGIPGVTPSPASPTNAFKSATIIRNDPVDGVALTVLTESSAGRAFATLSLQRGQRLVFGQLTSGSTDPAAANGVFYVKSADGEAHTAITAGNRATNDDANGHRYVVVSAAYTATDGADALMTQDSDDTDFLDFGLGLAVDGGSATTGNTATDLMNQYGAWVGIHTRVTTL